jgi:hypothetical protein
MEHEIHLPQLSRRKMKAVATGRGNLVRSNMLYHASFENAGDPASQELRKLKKKEKHQLYFQKLLRYLVWVFSLSRLMKAANQPGSSLIVNYFLDRPPATYAFLTALKMNHCYYPM